MKLSDFILWLHEFPLDSDVTLPDVKLPNGVATMLQVSHKNGLSVRLDADDFAEQEPTIEDLKAKIGELEHALAVAHGNGDPDWEPVVPRPDYDESDDDYDDEIPF